MPSYAVSEPPCRVSIVDTLQRTATRSSSNFFSRELERAYRSGVSSQFHTNRNYVYAWIESLDQLLNVGENWNSYGAPPPAENAVRNSKKVLGSLAGSGIVPDAVKASAEGGVAIVFSGVGRNRAIIESLNNDEQYALLYDLDGRSRTIDWPTEGSDQLVLEMLESHLREEHCLPLSADQVDTGLQFESSQSFFTGGSPRTALILWASYFPSELNTFSFDKDLDSAPSVLRSARSASPVDALAIDCA